jgi:hypothetical protein
MRSMRWDQGLIPVASTNREVLNHDTGVESPMRETVTNRRRKAPKRGERDAKKRKRNSITRSSERARDA